VLCGLNDLASEVHQFRAGQRFALEGFHHRKIDAILGADVIEMADIGMVWRSFAALYFLVRLYFLI
jgi:hypothetical protein